MIGVAFRRAASSTSSPGRRAWASARARASRRIRSDSVLLPLVISLAVKRAVVRFAGTVWYLALRGTLTRRGISANSRAAGRLRAVLAAALAAIPHAGRVEGGPRGRTRLAVILAGGRRAGRQSTPPRSRARSVSAARNECQTSSGPLPTRSRTTFRGRSYLSLLAPALAGVGSSSLSFSRN